MSDGNRYKYSRTSVEEDMERFDEAQDSKERKQDVYIMLSKLIKRL